MLVVYNKEERCALPPLDLVRLSLEAGLASVGLLVSFTGAATGAGLKPSSLRRSKMLLENADMTIDVLFITMDDLLERMDGCGWDRRRVVVKGKVYYWFALPRLILPHTLLHTLHHLDSPIPFCPIP